MSDGDALCGHVWRALGKAAAIAGRPADLYRPRRGAKPLGLENRVLRLHALFKRPVLRAVRPGGYGKGLWEGTFDARYTRPGDYLVEAGGATWFIAEQLPMQQPLCIRTIRSVSFDRQRVAESPGATGYGGIAAGGAPPLLVDWPAAIAAADGNGETELTEIAVTPQTVWSVLLPPIAWLALRPGDVMRDENGEAGVVEAAESTSLGWRLGVRRAAS